MINTDNKLLVKDLEHVLEGCKGECWNHLWTVVELAKGGYYHLGRKEQL